MVDVDVGGDDDDYVVDVDEDGDDIINMKMGFFL